MNSAPISCSAGISRGKLKGVTKPTGPHGQRMPWLICPAWSPDTPNDLAINLGCTAVHLSLYTPMHCTLCPFMAQAQSPLKPQQSHHEPRPQSNASLIDLEVVMDARHTQA